MLARENLMAVSKIRITADQLSPRVQKAAQSSSNIVFIPPPKKKSMGGMMQHLQVLKCLREGSIVGKPRLNEHGHWEFNMEAFLAGVEVDIRVIAETDGPHISKLYVFTEK
jgi:hypothetical protein